MVSIHITMSTPESSLRPALTRCLFDRKVQVVLKVAEDQTFLGADVRFFIRRYRIGGPRHYFT